MIEKLKPSLIPNEPGSYQFKDADGRIIYVGKARSLRSRLANYFQPIENLHPRTASMVSAAKSVEWIVVRNEVEALILEHNLIQRYHPRFNIRMRDDKSYPFIAITSFQKWPRVGMMRGQRKKGVRYFGPYPHSNDIRELLDLLLRTFPIRTCTDSKFIRHQRLERPCLLYHIEKCCGPCAGMVSSGEYQRIVGDLAKFLKGDTKEFIERLKTRMLDSAQNLNFEQAAKLRDQLELTTKAIEKQQMVGGVSFNADVFGIYQDELEAAIQVFFVRKGRVVGRKGFLVEKVDDSNENSLMSHVIEEFYTHDSLEYPPEILLPFAPENSELLTEWLSGLRGSKTSIKIPVRGEKKALLDTVNINASAEFKRSRMSRASDHNSRARALRSLAEELNLSQPPLRIECYDMSHLQGTNYVGSMVVMEDGLMKKSDYRRFKVHVPSNDDFAAMYEVLSRRFSYLDDENGIDGNASKRFSYPPALIVVDGGKGQLSMAHKALVDSGHDGRLTLIGLAKQFEEVFKVGEKSPVRISRGSEALYLLQQLRDEAHRFAITYHRQLRSKSLTKSSLESVAGMGPARTKKLLAQYGGIKNLAKASKDELLELQWLPTQVAVSVYEALHFEQMQNTR